MNFKIDYYNNNKNNDLINNSKCFVEINFDFIITLH